MPLDKNGLSEQEFLAQYDPGDFPRPSLTVDMTVFTVSGTDTGNYRKLPQRELRVLLVRRGGHPYLGYWALPGGFVRPTETVGQAAARELREETGVSGIYLEQLYTFSEPGRDPRTWVVSSAHMALVDSAALQVQGGDDADEAAWFQVTVETSPEHPRQVHIALTRESLELAVEVELGDNPGDAEGYRILHSEGVAFDHAKILVYSLLRLREKVEHTPIALHLVPEEFTLTELQQVYEVILGRPLLAAAFRRKVVELVEETGKRTANAGHRPSRLFRRKTGSQ